MVLWYTNPTFLIVMLMLNALVGAAIGQKKNRLVAGLVFGFLLGPIGWLVIALGPDMGPKCPECGGPIVKGAKRCKNCGAILEHEESLEERLEAMDFPDKPFSGPDEKG